jgi:hypothetical protein
VTLFQTKRKPDAKKAFTDKMQRLTLSYTVTFIEQPGHQAGRSPREF